MNVVVGVLTSWDGKYNKYLPTQVVEVVSISYLYMYV
jgi:hypothetical protein